MRIAHLSDLHYTHITWNPLRLLSKRLLGNLNWLFTRYSSFCYAQLDPLPQLFQELEVDVILLGGDLTTTSMREEYEKGASFVKTLPAQWFAVPGNHDCYTLTSFRKRLFYNFFTNPPGISSCTLKNEGIELHRLTAQWWLIALDTARPTNPYSSKGLFTEQQERICKKLLNEIPSSDSVICLNHYPFFKQPSPRCNLRRKEALQTLLEVSPQIRLYLQGHTHRHAIADLQESRLPILVDSGSCVQKNGTWNLIDLMSDHCTVTAYTWKNQIWTPFQQTTIPWKMR